MNTTISLVDDAASGHAVEAARLLVVEANEAIGKLLCKHLELAFNLPVDLAGTMAECRQFLVEHTADYKLAVADLNLPDADTGAAVDVLCAAEVAVIVLAGDISEATYQRIAFLPIADFVLKTTAGVSQIVERSVRRVLRNFDRHVLLIDESESFAEYLAGLLRNQRLRVSTASTMADALELLRQHQDICLAISESAIAKSDGVLFCAQLRDRRPVGSFGIIGITADIDPFVGVRFLKAGADDILRKPFLTEEFASRVNSCLDHLDVVNQVRNQANRDFLTGLYNRRYLFDAGSGLFENARRENLHMAVAMIDIDHFKRVNDTYGHDVGDQVLIALAKLLTASFRATDLIARLGGEEFCIVTVNAADPPALMDRFRQRVEALRLPLESAPDAALQFTISIGLSTPLGDTLEAMIKHADEALYQAKKGGRNRVVVSG